MTALNIKQNKNIRNKNYIRIVNKMIQAYIKNPIGNLNLWYKPIRKLPNNLKVINGYLDIRFTNISELHRGLVINSWLDIRWSNISQLPNQLVVKGDLDIRYTNISELPDDIIIEGSLYCNYTQLNEKYSNEEIKSKYNIKGFIYGT